MQTSHNWETKDELLKKSPYIIEWNNLSEEIKGYDRDQVKLIPEVLALEGKMFVRKSVAQTKN